VENSPRPLLSIAWFWNVLRKQSGRTARWQGDSIPRIDDLVNHPRYYTFGKYEVIDVLEE
jgi:hypothetical protein